MAGRWFRWLRSEARRMVRRRPQASSSKVLNLVSRAAGGRCGTIAVRVCTLPRFVVAPPAHLVSIDVSPFGRLAACRPGSRLVWGAERRGRVDCGVGIRRGERKGETGRSRERQRGNEAPIHERGGEGEKENGLGVYVGSLRNPAYNLIVRLNSCPSLCHRERKTLHQWSGHRANVVHIDSRQARHGHTTPRRRSPHPLRASEPL